MSDIRDVASLPLAQSVIMTLLKNGFRFVKDILETKPLDLSRELKVPPVVALSIIKCAQESSLCAINSVRDSNKSSSKSNNQIFVEDCPLTAKDLLEKLSTQKPIITFCKEMDVMLGGGIPIGQITEICGVPGIGKTQLGIQLALNVQIPEVFNGNEGTCIYIDTEGSFLPERAAEMAQELSSHLTRLVKVQRLKSTPSASSTSHAGMDLLTAQTLAAEEMTMERFLAGITYYRCHTQSEFLAILHLLPSLLTTKSTSTTTSTSNPTSSKPLPPVKLIILDSIAFLFRADIQEINARNRILAEVIQSCNTIVYEHHLAMVMMNHVTTKIVKIPSSHLLGYNPGDETAEQSQVAPKHSSATTAVWQKDAAMMMISQDEQGVLFRDLSGTGGIGYVSNSTRRNLSASTSISTTVLVPALGEQWSHGITNRILLHYPYQQSNGIVSNQTSAISYQSPSMLVRMATLMKSPSMANKSIPFAVTAKGIRDMSTVIPSTAPSQLSSTTITQSASEQTPSGRGMPRNVGDKRPRDF